MVKITKKEVEVIKKIELVVEPTPRAYTYYIICSERKLFKSWNDKKRIF